MIFMRTEYELGELIEYEQPTKYAVESTKYDDKYSTPVLTAGKSFILGYTNETDGIYDNLPVIIFDDFTTATQYVNFKFKVKSSAMKILKANEELALTKYLYYLMQTIHCDHDTHKRYWIQTYSKIKVAIPDITEQQHIVDKIEELFSKLDKGVEELNKVKEQLKIYRQAVLKEAFEGKWSYDNRQSVNIETVDKTLVVELPTLPNEWEYVYLSKLGELSRGKSKHRPRNDKKLFEDGKYPFVQTGDVKAANKYLTSYSTMYGEFGLAQSKLWKKGTLCITIAANIAETCILGIDACFPDSVVGFDPQEDIVDRDYVRYFIEASKIRLSAFAPATAQKNINLTTLENLIIPYCHIDEQKYIVTEIESRLSVCDKIEQTVSESLQKSESLRQSILKQAFEGKLV